MESPISCVSTTSCSAECFAHNMWKPLTELLFHEQVSGTFEPFVMKLTWLSSNSLVILPLIYSATRKAFTILHDASSGTIARGVY